MAFVCQVSEAEYEQQVQRVSGILQRTTEEPMQQSDALLDILAGFFEEVANTAATTTAPIPAEVREYLTSRSGRQALPNMLQVLTGYADSLGSLQQWEADLLASSSGSSRSATTSIACCVITLSLSTGL